MAPHRTVNNILEGTVREPEEHTYCRTVECKKHILFVYVTKICYTKYFHIEIGLEMLEPFPC
jgi:hypothetical protein